MSDASNTAEQQGKVGHTPGPTQGPWVSKHLGSYKEPGHVVMWRDTSKGGVHMRRLDYQGNFTPQDAALIAAAPDLLAALKGILAAEEDWGETDRPHMVAARAAIARAEGQA